LSQRALLSLIAAGTIWILGTATASQAAQVLVLAHDGRVTAHYEPLPAWITNPPSAAHLAKAVPRLARVSVLADLFALYQRLAISSASYQSYAASMRAANAALRQLNGAAAAELGAVIGNLRTIAAHGMLTPGRLPALFLTLDRNRQWWTSGQIPGANQIVTFAGSQIDWEYYPGQGLEIQELASFFKADWLFTHGSCCNQYQRGTALLSELIPLASRRAGGMTWEYYFNFDGGVPPWTSAMSQGTALEALADGYTAVRDHRYLSVAHQALPVLETSPSRGVNIKTARGIRFVQYSFDPARHDEILNAFLQTLIGLDTYAQASGDPTAQSLFNAGNAEAQHEVPYYDTGSWSLYQPGVPDDVNYHQITTQFLQTLCSSTNAPVYCRTAAHFRAYMQHPPAGVG